MPQRLHALRADLETLLRGGLGDARHDFARDFGWPTAISPAMLRRTFERNALAAAAVQKVTAKTWRQSPRFVFDGEQEAAGFQDMAERTRLFARLAQADSMAQVQGFSALLLRIADGRALSKPLGTAAGFAGLVGVEPLWADQLTVEAYDEDLTSATYGQPLSFVLSGQIGGAAPTQTHIHASRLLIVSADGTITAPSSLAAGYNALLTWQKIMGAGGEGFWRNARNSLIFNLDKETDLNAMATSIGANGVGDLADKIEEVTKAFQDGFDASLIGKGMSVTTLPVSLPQPEQFARLPIQAFAATMGIPLRLLLGNETGERASTQDIKEFNDTIEARRTQQTRPILRTFIERLQTAKILIQPSVEIEWVGLSEH